MGPGLNSPIFGTSLAMGESMTKIGGMVATASRQGPRNAPPSDSEAKHNHAMSHLGQGV